ncbi:MAG: GntR family transcriptional regulator [Limnohabitans sp.]|nr:GntR family transcriptional regulator [Limnohabitans sp.]
MDKGVVFHRYLQPVQSESTDTSQAGWSYQAIYKRIVESVLDHRLLPGTRLTEDKLCSIFGVSRTRIKPILVRLANEKIITLTHNLGASVSNPTQQESIEVFETRRLIEPVLLKRFMARAQAADIAHLSNVIAQDRQAQEQGDMHKASGLTGEFHLYIADRAGHNTLSRLMHELVPRTCLILMAWGSQEKVLRREHAACGCQEHRQLLDAIRLRDTAVAEKLMESHLHTLENQLNFEQTFAPSLELEQFLLD